MWLQQTGRANGGYATLGGCMPRSRCVRLEAMNNADLAGLDGPCARCTPHDRRVAADIGYRVWNPFEAELRIDATGRYDEVAKGFTRVMDVFER